MFAQFTWHKQVAYNLQNQTVNQTETRTTDGSHMYLDDLWYEVTVMKKDGKIAETYATKSGTRSAAFGFAVRHGITVRIAESFTQNKPPRDQLPQRMQLDEEVRYRMVNTESFGPTQHIRDWAIDQTGLEFDSFAGRQLRDFFSSESFHRMSRTMAAGSVNTPPLFRDDAGRKPIGVFTVRVTSGEAVLISETSAAEIRDILQTTVRNERTTRTSSTVDIGGAVGPALQLLGLDHGGFDLRLMAGLNSRYGSTHSRTSATGGSGSIRSAGQTKGDPTGVYVVQKTVTVTSPPALGASQPTHEINDVGRPHQLDHPSSAIPASRTRTFQTWAVERINRTEALRLTGGKGTPRGTEPPAPPYLTRESPATLAMSRVEEFTFSDGAQVKDIGGQKLTFPEYFANQVLHQIEHAYPGLVAPLAELDPNNPKWRNADHFQIVMANTLEVLNTLSAHSMAGNLETLMTTGLRIALIDSKRITRAHRYVWINAHLADRRYENTQKDLRLRFSAPGSENLTGQQGAASSTHVGLEGLISLRDGTADPTTHGPLQAGTASAGIRFGSRDESTSGYGVTAAHEGMSIGTKGTHLYSYEITLTARRGGFSRFRGLLRGFLSLNLLGTQPFVFIERESPLPSTEAENVAPTTTRKSPKDTGATHGAPSLTGAPSPHGAIVGRVLLGIPVEHAPTTPMAAQSSPDPRHGVPETMPSADARNLALGTRDFLDHAGRIEGDEYKKHPHQTLAVTTHPELSRAAVRTLAESSGNSWMLTTPGTPVHDAALRVFQSQFLTANFDQTSTPAGWRASQLWAKAPYLDRTSVLAHRTRITPGTMKALTAAIPIETETTLGGLTQTVGTTSRTTSLFFGGQVAYLHAHDTGTGTTGNYGLVASPYRLDRHQIHTIARAALTEINRKDLNRQILVIGDVDHEIAAASSTIGEGAVRRRWIPRALAHAAGRDVHVSNGWVGHLPEKSAHRLGLINDPWGDVPLYTNRTWSPHSWSTDHPFGSFPLSGLNTAGVLSDFDKQLRPLGFSAPERDTLSRMVSERIVRALGKEMMGAGTSVPGRIGRWGSRTAQLWIGHRQVRVRAELIPIEASSLTSSQNQPGFRGLGHSVELEEHRQAIETVSELRGRSSGASVGTIVSEGAHTGNDTVRTAGPTYAETGAILQTATQTQSDGTVRIGTVTTTQAHGEFATRYRLRLLLEVSGPETLHADKGLTGYRRDGFERTWRTPAGPKHPGIAVEGDVGEIIEHYPLSLMRPDPTDASTTQPDPLTAATPHQPGTARWVTPPRMQGQDNWLNTAHPDGVLRPFGMPEDGFKIRSITGLNELHTSNALVIAAAYDASLPRTRVSDEVLARAFDTPLTRTGSGPAQTLENSTTNAALTSFYERTLTPSGYQVAGLTARTFLGGADGDLRLYSRPNFRYARLLTVADGVKHEAPKRGFQGRATTAGRADHTEVSFGGGPGISSAQTGTNQLGAYGPGDASSESETLAAVVDRLGSINVKPNSTRSFLFAIPTTWLSVATVHHHIKDSRIVRTTFGSPHRGPQARESESDVIAWVREDVARTLGLINETSFPVQVATAWDAVTKADKEWTAADKRYWEQRREEGPRVESALRAAESNLTRQSDLHQGVRTDLEKTTAAITQLDENARSAETAHDDWDRLLSEERRFLQNRLQHLQDAITNLSTAQSEVRSAQGRADALALRLATLRAEAEALADEYARVREGADKLTNWHQMAATAEGRARLGTAAEPPTVTFSLPKGPSALSAAKDVLPAPAVHGSSKLPTGIKGEGKTTRPAQATTQETRPAVSATTRAARRENKRPVHPAPPWKRHTPETDPPGFDAASDYRTLVSRTEEQARLVFDLVEPHGEGNRFFAAVLHALGDGGLSKSNKLHPSELAALAGQTAVLQDDMELDFRAAFRAEELATVLPDHFSDETDLDVLEQSGGSLPNSVQAALSPFQRIQLTRLIIQQGRRWNRATEESAAAATAQSLGIDLTVVQEDGSFSQHRSSPNSHAVAPRVIVYRRGDSFLAAIPRSIPHADLTAPTSSATEVAAALRDSSRLPGDLGAAVVIGDGETPPATRGTGQRDDNVESSPTSHGRKAPGTPAPVASPAQAKPIRTQEPRSPRPSQRIGTWWSNNGSARPANGLLQPTLDPLRLEASTHETDLQRTDRSRRLVHPTEGHPDTGTAVTGGSGAFPSGLQLMEDASQGGDWVPRALAAALVSTAPALLHRPGLGTALSRPDPTEAFHRWAEGRLAAEDNSPHLPSLTGDNWAGGRSTVSLGDLASIGADVTASQAMFAELTNGSLPMSEVALTPLQRYRLLRWWGAHDGALTQAAADLAALDLGVVIKVVLRGEAKLRT
ncbi:hypothetical protein [Streptomyces sp. NPDC059215]|uniref:hypothetical protein n=1 Tax=Streptomyces sp. NPDC059215 TaxID=3346772 RepID=UPI0036A37D32